MKIGCALGVSLGLLYMFARVPLAAPAQPPVSPSGSVFTVDAPSGRGVPGPVPGQPNDRSYDLAIIRFNDDGRARTTSELPAALECIRQARHYGTGALVALFIHGWHHNADWDPTTGAGDTHFSAFRQMLTMVAQRESERMWGPAGRRVVGVYIGWNGDPADSSSFTTFGDRYETAERIGNGADLRQAVRQIVAETKGPLQPLPGRSAPPPRESPLALIGHSMGALMLQSVFLTLLNDQQQPLVQLSPNGARPVDVRRGGQRIAFPDLVLSVNSAADFANHEGDHSDARNAELREKSRYRKGELRAARAHYDDVERRSVDELGLEVREARPQAYDRRLRFVAFHPHVRSRAVERVDVHKEVRAGLWAELALSA